MEAWGKQWEVISGGTGGPGAEEAARSPQELLGSFPALRKIRAGEEREPAQRYPWTFQLQREYCRNLLHSIPQCKVLTHPLHLQKTELKGLNKPTWSEGPKKPKPASRSNEHKGINEQQIHGTVSAWTGHGNRKTWFFRRSWERVQNPWIAVSRSHCVKERLS